MDLRARHGILVGLIALLAGSPAAAQATSDSLPPGVTPAMVAAGKKIFLGQGLCLACHGENAKGVIGPDLTDDTWFHWTGTYADIMAQITAGTDASRSKTGHIMPPLGGSGINEAQVRAVAAYVWTLSHRPGRKSDH